MKLEIALETRILSSIIAASVIFSCVVLLIYFGVIDLVEYVRGVGVALTFLAISILVWGLKPVFHPIQKISQIVSRSLSTNNTVISHTSDEEIEVIEDVQAHLFFPPEVPRKERTLEYHKRHLQHRLIVNLKVYPNKSYYLPTNSYGWKLVEKFPDLWVSDNDPTPFDDNFTQKWCDDHNYRLIHKTAQKKDLIEKEGKTRLFIKHVFHI